MKDQVFKAYQMRLKALGYYKGRIDGVSGPMIESATIDFKTQVNLRPRAFVGPITLSKLFANSAPKAPIPVYAPGDERLALVEARRQLGVREFSGKANNPIIMDWADELDMWYPEDDLAWCGLFTAHCEAAENPDQEWPENRLGARNWLEYGKSCKPGLGALAVFWRTHPTKSWNGHVGYLVGQEGKYFYVLGGNQSDSVSIMKIKKSRLLGCRLPEAATYSLPALPQMTNGVISYNEA